MNAKRRTLILIGSPKQDLKCASLIAGSVLAKALTDNGASYTLINLTVLMKSEKWAEELLDLVNSHENIVFSSPIQNGGPPSFVIRAMDILKENMSRIGKGKGLFAISNCGFPEAKQNNSAVNIYRQFSKETGLSWLGSFAIGMGPMLMYGRGLVLKILGVNIRRASSMAAEAIVCGEPVPKKAEELASRPMIPISAYILKHNFDIFKNEIMFKIRGIS
jgi:multimeric flavodoxin WrbA